jgi:hypothetical protein
LAEPSTGIWLCKLRSLDLCRHRTLASRAGRPFINVTFSELTVARRVHLWPRLQNCSSSLLIKPGPFLLTPAPLCVVTLSVSPSLGIGSWPPISSMDWAVRDPLHRWPK